MSNKYNLLIRIDNRLIYDEVPLKGIDYSALKALALGV